MDAIDYERLQIKGIGPQGLGRRALQLSMTETKSEEDALKRQFLREGIVAVATEVGGTSDTDFQTKAARAVIGAALNSGLVEKEGRSIHALMHATEEAKRGVLVNTASSASLAMKIAIVRNKGWVAVAFYGESSLPVFSCHERVGLGVMHLPDLDRIEK